MGPANVPWSLAGLGSKVYEEASEETNATDRNTNPSVTSLQKPHRNTPPHPHGRDKSVCCRSNREANKVQVAAGTGGRRGPAGSDAADKRQSAVLRTQRGSHTDWKNKPRMNRAPADEEPSSCCHHLSSVSQHAQRKVDET